MNKITKKDVLDAFGASDGLDDADCSFDGSKLRVWRMYEFVPVNFTTLQAVAKLFGTEKISTPEYDSEGGCETCDYGSRYEVELSIEGARFNCLSDEETKP